MKFEVWSFLTQFWTFFVDGFVKEEYEKAERQVPQWKIQWCKENLTNMIGKDDQDAHSFSRSRTGVGAKKAKKGKKRQSRVAKAMGEQMKKMVAE